jgi:hypothetical protein
MKPRVLFPVLALLFAQSVLATDPEHPRASFERMLQHPPYTGVTTVTTERSERDPLERSFAQLPKSDPGAVVRSLDPYGQSIGESFARMFEHAPHPGPTGTTVARTTDHTVDRLVLMATGIPGRAQVHLAAHTR